MQAAIQGGIYPIFEGLTNTIIFRIINYNKV